MNDKEKYNGSYDVAMIEKYLQGQLTAAEMHTLEKAALEDPFLADAIEGIRDALQKQNVQTLTSDINELRQRLQQRIGKKNQTARVIA